MRLDEVGNELHPLEFTVYGGSYELARLGLKGVWGDGRRRKGENLWSHVRLQSHGAPPWIDGSGGEMASRKRLTIRDMVVACEYRDVGSQEVRTCSYTAMVEFELNAASIAREATGAHVSFWTDGKWEVVERLPDGKTSRKKMFPTIEPISIAISDDPETFEKGGREYRGAELGRFDRLDTLRKVTVTASSVAGVGAYAFWGCTSLLEVSLPSSVSSIGDSAFEGCLALERVDLHGSLRSIGARAFAGCKSLRSVAIPSSIESIGAGAFAGCGLGMVLLPPGVRVSPDAFDDNVAVYTETRSPGDPLRGAVGNYPALTFPSNDRGVSAVVEYQYVDKASRVEARDIENRLRADASAAFAGTRSSLADEGGLARYLGLASEAEANVLEITEALALALASKKRIATAQHNRDSCAPLLDELRRGRAEAFADEERLAISMGERLRVTELWGIGERPTHGPIPKQPVEPKEPKYEQAGLFNRKKAQARNDELRAEYRRQLSEYAEAKRVREQLIEEYRAALDGWRARRNAAIGAQLEELDDMVSSRMAEERAADELVDEELAAAFEAADELCTMLRSCLADAEAILAKVYSTGTVFPKYRTLEAVSTMCEYIETGRCSELAGPGGAYNLYESELRANAIIGKLDTMNEKLDDIKRSQYMLYAAVEGVSRRLDSVTATLGSVLEEVRRTRASVEKISGHTSDIVASSAATAYWVRRNAQLTDSLGYLIAFSAL